MNIRKLWPLLPLALAVSFVVANGQGLGGGGAVQTQAAAEADSPSEEVRALAGALAARDRRLEDVEERLHSLSSPPPASPATRLSATSSAATTPAAAPLTAALVEKTLVENPLQAGDRQPQPADDLRPLIDQLRHLTTLLRQHLNTASAVAAPVAYNAPVVEQQLPLGEVAAPAALQRQAPLVWLGEADSIDGEDADAQQSQGDDDRHFYVPAGTTAPDTLLITSLIGRIPKSGQVTSPMPFKALVGAAVLVAPGENLPQLRGAVLQGEAVGDLLLSCVRAQIHSATLIAADGSYMQAGDGDSDGERLGYLSDPVGNPCIPGQLISDFPRTLLAASATSALDAAGSALAAEQYLLQTDLPGAGLLRQDPEALLGGSALAGGGATLTDWIRARASDSFDAVIIPSGGKVVAHFSREMVLAHRGRKPGRQD